MPTSTSRSHDESELKYQVMPSDAKRFSLNAKTFVCKIYSAMMDLFLIKRLIIIIIIVTIIFGYFLSIFLYIEIYLYIYIYHVTRNNFTRSHYMTEYV